MSGLNIGSMVRDNDPREEGRRVLVVYEITETHAWLRPRTGGLTGITRVRLDRIYTDSKPRRSGWSVVA